MPVCGTMHDEQLAALLPVEDTKEKKNSQQAAPSITPPATRPTTPTPAAASTVIALVAAVQVATAPNVKLLREPTAIVPSTYSQRPRASWISTERMNELRRAAQEAVRQNKTFTIRGCFNSVRHALLARGWVEKLDIHRKQIPSGICQVTYEDLAQTLPKRRPGETRRQYIGKCERNIISRFLEHMPIDFLWTNRKEKCDYIDQAKNPGMTINKFHRAPFTTKEGLCNQLHDFHWFYEEGTAEMYFPRCFNVWSPEELSEFVENFKLTACVCFVRVLVDRYRERGFEAVFSPLGKLPLSSIDFAFKRCTEHIDCCEHNDIDLEPPKTWEHDWDVFLGQHQLLVNDGARLLSDSHRLAENIMATGAALLENMANYWPQYSLDGYRNLWIVKPANKCRGRGIQLVDNLKKILALVNPATASKSRYVVQKYIERPLIIHNTKFDIRQWFLITNVQPLMLWMYKESYLRFSSQPYSLSNHHESVHLTNHAIQKKYTNGQGRDKRLPAENMWDCYSFQAFLRQIGKQHMWFERIYPGMRKAIVGTMLASQENMDRRPNTFELFGADFMICENFYPWLIEINSSPDLGATTSVTARLCPQCLEDVIKVVIDRRSDVKADLGNFELIYRQSIPSTPAYMGLNLFVKGKQLATRSAHGNGQTQYGYHRKERSLSTSNFYRHRTTYMPTHISNVHRVMPSFNATEFIERSIAADALNSSRSSTTGGLGVAAGVTVIRQFSPTFTTSNNGNLMVNAPPTPCPSLLKTAQKQAQFNRVHRKSYLLSPTSVKSNTLASSKSGQPDVAGAMHLMPSKRHQSCGPRLNVNNTPINAEPERKLKFIIRKWSGGVKTSIGRPSAVAPSQPPETPDVLRFKQLQLRSHSCFLEAQRTNSRLQALAYAATGSRRRAAKMQRTSPPQNKQASSCRRRMQGVQAIVGRGLSTWQSSLHLKDSPNKATQQRNSSSAPTTAASQS